MCNFYSIGLTFLTGMLGIWKAVPVGLAFSCHPFTIILSTSLGALLSIFIIFFLGHKIKLWIQQKLIRKSEKKQKRLHRLFEKYGTIGMGVLGTLLMGPNMTMAIGLVIVKNEKALLLWTAVGIIIWTAALTLAGHYSIGFFSQLF
jgi:membrane protein DedA with SNARE-associated domain